MTKMENYGRRGRRGRNRSRPVPSSMPQTGHNFTPATSKPWSFLSALYSLFIMASLIAITYLMLEYHCKTCSADCNMKSITRNIDDIAKNLSYMKQSYLALEEQISKFSLEIPKLEGQIEILEALANIMDAKELGWNPRTHMTLPYVDVYLAKNEGGKNISCLSSNRLPKIEINKTRF